MHVWTCMVCTNSGQRNIVKGTSSQNTHPPWKTAGIAATQQELQSWEHQSQALSVFQKESTEMRLASRRSPANSTCHYWCGELGACGRSCTFCARLDLCASPLFPSFFVVPNRMLTREVAALSVDAADLMGSSGMINTLRGGTVSGSSADVLSIVAFKNERANQLHSYETTVRSDSISSASRLAHTYMCVYMHVNNVVWWQHCHCSENWIGAFLTYCKSPRLMHTIATYTCNIPVPSYTYKQLQYTYLYIYIR